jgi:mRNA deadenylase 3'-5' endonuclease subunit Ccr4
MFPRVPDEFLDFDARFEKLERILDRLDADIVCLQEVDFSMNSRVVEYDQMFSKRSRKKQDGCLSCWKRDRFVLKNSQFVEFNDIRMTALDENRVLRDNVALIVELIELSRNRRVIVANTHLYYHPEYNDVRLVQIRYLIQRLEEFIGGRDAIVLLCGDFNSLPNQNVYKYITNGQVDNCASGNDRVKLMLEGDLKKLHKWLKMLRIDATFERTNSAIDYDGILKKAKERTENCCFEKQEAYR